MSLSQSVDTSLSQSVDTSLSQSTNCEHHDIQNNLFALICEIAAYQTTYISLRSLYQISQTCTAAYNTVANRLAVYRQIYNRFKYKFARRLQQGFTMAGPYSRTIITNIDFSLCSSMYEFAYYESHYYINVFYPQVYLNKLPRDLYYSLANIVIFARSPFGFKLARKLNNPSGSPIARRKYIAADFEQIGKQYFCNAKFTGKPIALSTQHTTTSLNFTCKKECAALISGITFIYKTQRVPQCLF